MTEPTSGTAARAAQGSRAAAQQMVIEERFHDFLQHGRFLNIGSGQAPMLGDAWENVDSSPSAPADHHFDLLKTWPLPDDRYDAVTAVHVLEHFTGEELFHILWEAGRVLRTGGSLAVVVPHGLHSYHYSNPFHKRAWTEDTPFQFDRRLYEQENTQSTGANQGQKLHAWTISNMTFVPSPEWKNEPDDMIQTAMKRHLNVITEFSFVMTLEEK